MWIILLIAFVIYYLIHKYLQQYYYWQNKGLNVVLRPLPLFGSVYQHIFGIKCLAESVQEIYVQFPNEKIIGLHTFTEPILLAKDVDLIRQVTVKDFDDFTDHNMSTNENDTLFGKSLFALAGQRWRDMRNTLSPAFTGSKMRAMITCMYDSGNQLVDYLKNEIESHSGRSEIEVKDVFTRYTNDVIASVAFGIQCDSFKDKDNDFYRAGKIVTKFTLKANLIMVLYTLFPNIMKYTRASIFDPKIEKFFRERILNNVSVREQHGITRNDMLNLLIQARKGQLKNEDTSDDAGFATVQEITTGKTRKIDLSDEDIVAQAFIFYFAGYETSSIVMSFMAYELTVNEDIQRKLRQEIDETLEKSNGLLDYDVIRSMKYLDMVVSEVLRKWPPAPFIERTCTKPTILKVNDTTSIIMNKKDSIWIPSYSIHRDPKYYPNPEKFDPERFSDENKSNISPFLYLPFGLGPRNCIGSRFALLEVKILCIKLLKNFEFYVTENTQIPMKLMKSGFNVLPDKGVVHLGIRLRK